MELVVGGMGRLWPCEVTSGPHTSIMCSCDQQRNCNVILRRLGNNCLNRLFLYVQLHLDFPQRKSIFIFTCSSVYVCICMHVCIYFHSEQTAKEMTWRRARERKGRGGNTSEHSCPLAAVWSSTSVRGRLRLSYSRGGTAVWIVWGFLLIAPPLPPEGWLWSLHTFKFQNTNGW